MDIQHYTTQNMMHMAHRLLHESSTHVWYMVTHGCMLHGHSWMHDTCMAAHVYICAINATLFIKCVINECMHARIALISRSQLGSRAC